MDLERKKVLTQECIKEITFLINEEKNASKIIQELCKIVSSYNIKEVE